LGGNLLIKDTDDIFFYPQRVSDYNRLVTYDFGPRSGSPATESSFGSGGMIFGGESLVIGAFSHRSDFMSANRNAFANIGDAAGSGTGQAGGDIPPGGPFNWIDLILGWQGGDNPWGARLSIGRSQADPDTLKPDVKQDVTSVDVVIGFTVNDIDVAGEFSIASAEDKRANGDVIDVQDASPLGFAVSARKTATAESDDLQLGWLGMFSFESGGGDFTPAVGQVETTDLSELAFVFGAGPVYTPHERTSVAMYGTFAYVRDKVEEADGDIDTDTDYVIPGWHIAAEVELASWLQARAGLVSRFAIRNSNNEATNTPALDSQTTDLSFSWHTGVGIAFDDFMIDGYINPDAITAGTDVLGDSSALFGMVSASYAF
jgi:hypothetical protein